MGAEKRKRQKAAKAAAEDAAKGAEEALLAEAKAASHAASAEARAAKVAKAIPVTSQSLSVGSNWKRLLERRPTIAPKTVAQKKSTSVADGGASEIVVALDCEMVGVGPGGIRSVLARLSIVDHEGKVLIDAFVRQSEKITDYRTHITGITAATLDGPKVMREEAARKRAAELMEGKVVVGHAVQHDFQALLMSHPQSMTRDTALFRPLRVPGSEKKTPSLARLSEVWLHETIRESGKHDSVEDARMALRLYRLKSRLWEKELRRDPYGNGAGAEAGKSAGAKAAVAGDAGADSRGNKKLKRKASPAVAVAAEAPPSKRKRRSSE